MPVPLWSTPPASILIVKPSSLGDVVHTLPAVALLKRHWPHSQLRWLINPEWAPLLEDNPSVDEVVLFPRGQFRGVAGLTRFLPWLGEIRRNRSELVLDFQGLARSALIGRVCRGRTLVGLSDAREGARFLYDQVVDARSHLHAVNRYLALVASLGIDTAPPLEWPMPTGTPVPGLAPGYILLHPFSRGAGKSLCTEEVTGFCRAIAPHPVVIAGRSPEQIEPMAHVSNLLNATSIAQLIWLIRGARLTLSVDSGPMHIAAALGGPVVSIHTWSDPEKVGPYPSGSWIWHKSQLYQRGTPQNRRPVETVGQLAEWMKGEV